MTLQNYYRNLDAEGKRVLAERLGTSRDYLTQLANGHSRAGASILARISDASDGKVTPAEMRPDLYPRDTAA